MRFFLSIFALFAASHVCAVTATAATAKTNLETQALLRATTSPDDFSSRDSRLLLIDGAEAYCRSLKRVFPTNSPADDSWLQEEVAGGGDRPLRAISSIQMVRRMAANFVGECLHFAVMARANPDSPKAYVGLAIAFDKADGNLHIRANETGVDVEAYSLELGLGWSIKGFLRAAYAVS